MKTIIELRKEARVNLQKGVNILADAVKVTLGPAGRLVLIDRKNFQPHLTKDGVTVAKSVRINDKVQDLGAQLIRSAAERVVAKAGDGTTSVTTLTAELVNKGMTAVNKGYNPVLLKKGMLAASKDIILELKKLSTPVKESDLESVATISANGDNVIGDIIAKAILAVGVEGIVVIEESRNGETTNQLVDGMEISRGYASPYFVNDEGKMLTNLRNVDILLVNGRLSSLSGGLQAVLERSINNGTPLLIIAEEFDDKILSLLIVNKNRGTLNVCAVKAPGYGETKTHLMHDIAAVVGATVIDPTKGITMDELEESWLGHADRVTVSRDTTIVVDGGGDPNEVESRANNIKQQIEAATSEYDIERLQDRLSRIAGGVAVINVGGINETNMLERKDRFEDALFATKAAMDEGIIPGGGLAGILIKNTLDATLNDIDLSQDEIHGYELVVETLPVFLKTILSNAGYDNDEIIKILNRVEIYHKHLGYEVWQGVDIESGSLINYKEVGIFDPTKVLRAVIETGVEIASDILLVECVIAEEGEEIVASGLTEF